MACGGTATSPSSMTASAANATVSFNGLGTDTATVTTYTESGFMVSVMSGDWSARATYGNPAPFIQFWAPGGSAVTGAIQVRAAELNYGVRHFSDHPSARALSTSDFTSPFAYGRNVERNSAHRWICAARLAASAAACCTVASAATASGIVP
jgi:hypothetical protein